MYFEHLQIMYLTGKQKSDPNGKECSRTLFFNPFAKTWFLRNRSLFSNLRVYQVSIVSFLFIIWIMINTSSTYNISFMYSLHSLYNNTRVTCSSAVSGHPSSSFLSPNLSPRKQFPWPPSVPRPRPTRKTCRWCPTCSNERVLHLPIYISVCLSVRRPASLSHPLSLSVYKYFFSFNG